jgi:hypothetical protein
MKLKNIPFIILVSFLLTFLVARIVSYMMLIADKIPELFLYIRGVHIHHLNYGILILAIVGLYILLKNNYDKKTVAIIYGIGLGLTFDEFGMWLMLTDNYWIRGTYDAIVIIALALGIIAYAEHRKARKLARSLK